MWVLWKLRRLHKHRLTVVLPCDLLTTGLDDMLKRSDRIPGYAIGGLSGGECVPATLDQLAHMNLSSRHADDMQVGTCICREKSVFWRIVLQCTDRLPPEKPRYCMGIGYGEDLLVCAALGVDMVSSSARQCHAASGYC